jgi:hypothetical protein
VLKNGRRRVTKKNLKDFYGVGKQVSIDVTRRNPEVLNRYRRAKDRSPSHPLSHRELSDLVGTPMPDWDELLNAVTSTPAGLAHADRYHRSIEALLSALFYPALTMPIREHQIHEGRKRIDISYTNQAATGYFWWVHTKANIPASRIVVECKNYNRPLANPEFDQIAGRFSVNRGQVGILCYRSYEDKAKVISSCRDTALDKRGYILPIDDDDLRTLVAERRHGGHQPEFEHLYEIHRQLD